MIRGFFSILNNSQIRKIIHHAVNPSIDGGLFGMRSSFVTGSIDPVDKKKSMTTNSHQVTCRDCRDEKNQPTGPFNPFK